MTDVLAPAADYYQRLADLSTVPFWQLPEMHEPRVTERTHVWRWDDVVPELMRSRDLEDDRAGALQRRALLFRNPGLAPPAMGATQTLVAAYQMLFPGESAPVHSHSFSALRFGASGQDARMVVDGEAVPLLPGDLVLTPAWRWHGHVHAGGDEPVVWFDTLDVPFVMSLRAGFFREAPPTLGAAPPAPTAGTAATGLGVVPVDERPERHSPIRRYPWDEAYGTLQRLMAREGGEHGAVVEYRNPVTGGPALATIACRLQGLAPGTKTVMTRETASSVCFVARGSGAVVADGERYVVDTNDVVAIPAWTWHQIEADDAELVLFRVSDRPLHDAFGLYRSESL